MGFTPKKNSRKLKAIIRHRKNKIRKTVIVGFEKHITKKAFFIYDVIRLR